MDKKTFTLQDNENLQAEAAEVLSLFLRGDLDDEKMLRGAKIAATTFSSCTRVLSSSFAQDATNYAMARELADNKKELQAFINKAIPHSPLAKTLK